MSNVIFLKSCSSYFDLMGVVKDHVKAQLSQQQEMCASARLLQERDN